MKPVRFIHISDTHIGPTSDFSLRNVKTYEKTKQLIEYINKLPISVDFVMHTGDIAAVVPDEDSYRLSNELFKSLKYPTYYVTGNHDDSSMIRKYMAMPPFKELIKNDNLLAYTFESNNQTCIALDGKGPIEIDPHGVVHEELITPLQSQLEKAGSVIIFIHFPLLPLDCDWTEEKMLVLEGDKYHNVFAKYKKKIKGVFFGHIHRGTTSLQDGILYSSVGSAAFGIRMFPGQTEAVIDTHGVPSFNLVTVDQNKTTVKQYSLEEQFKS